MKKITVILLALAMLVMGVQCAFAEDDDGLITFETMMLGAMDMTADEWCEDSFNRALFMVCTVLDCLSVWDSDEETISIEAITLDNLYVTEDSAGTITAHFFGADALITVFYNPALDFASYSVMEMENAGLLSSVFMSGLADEDAFEDYYEVDGDIVFELINSLGEEE